ncbi:hypothetical protein ACAN107058_18560 [Paracidovorax anthurii]|uniref:Uncharacterized protein n=1 Tax=Paracidovorax anthurii TaxID=78229 RepID=A0A328YWF2_9BURK|nr:hypothetical protein AX018_103135 [Paracidovorax anthurii]
MELAPSRHAPGQEHGAIECFYFHSKHISVDDDMEPIRLQKPLKSPLPAPGRPRTGAGLAVYASGTAKPVSKVSRTSRRRRSRPAAR